MDTLEAVFPVPGKCRLSTHHVGGDRSVDIFAPLKTKVLAMEAGVVRAENWPQGGYTATLLGTSGREYYYAHLLGPALNGTVAKGGSIGRVGTSGSASRGCSHLHIAISDHDKRVDDFGNGSVEVATLLQNVAPGAVTVEDTSLYAVQPEKLYVLVGVGVLILGFATDFSFDNRISFSGYILVMLATILFLITRRTLYAAGQDYTRIAARVENIACGPYLLFRKPVALAITLLLFGFVLICSSFYTAIGAVLVCAHLWYKSKDMEQY